MNWFLLMSRHSAAIFPRGWWVGFLSEHQKNQFYSLDFQVVAYKQCSELHVSNSSSFIYRPSYQRVFILSLDFVIILCSFHMFILYNHFLLHLKCLFVRCDTIRLVHFRNVGVLIFHWPLNCICSICDFSSKAIENIQWAKKSQ